jgi:hypothetical protein
MKHSPVVVVLLLGTLACREDRPVRADLLAPIQPGTVQTVVQRVAQYGADSALFQVHVAARDVDVGAYQGELTFNPAALRVIEVRHPQVSGEFRVINSARAAEGSIRFAAFSAEAVRETQVFEFLAEPLMTLSAAHLSATLSVVGEVTGTAVSAHAVRANQGVRDASTNRVIVH